jgi:D-alanine-D-alanine ligase
VAFICIHGSPGEDGKLQGYLDMIGLPYTTCDAITSAITMNKAYTKSVIADLANVSVAKSMQVFANRRVSEESILSNLKLPLFVKPNFGGSSIGMSRVNTPTELGPALHKAFKEDDQLIIEEFISGREFTIGVVRIDGKIWVLPATEVISSKEFFDFEAKYTTGLTEEITPGRMSEAEMAKVQTMAAAIYERLNCAGVVRIDYIINETGLIYVLEINTVPGQSENSIIPQQVRATGMDMTTFYGLLVTEALK